MKETYWSGECGACAVWTHLFYVLPVRSICNKTEHCQLLKACNFTFSVQDTLKPEHNLLFFSCSSLSGRSRSVYCIPNRFLTFIYSSDVCLNAVQRIWLHFPALRGPNNSSKHNRHLFPFPSLSKVQDMCKEGFIVGQGVKLGSHCAQNVGKIASNGSSTGFISGGIIAKNWFFYYQSSPSVRISIAIVCNVSFFWGFFIGLRGSAYLSGYNVCRHNSRTTNHQPHQIRFWS